MQGGGGEYWGFQVTGMIEWSQKSKPKKIPRACSKTKKKNPGPKIHPQKIPCRFCGPLKLTIKQQNTFVCTLFSELRNQGTTNSF